MKEPKECITHKTNRDMKARIEFDGTYLKNGRIVYCYRHYFSGKMEIIETYYSM